MAEKSSGEVVQEAAAKSRDEYRASQPNLLTKEEAQKVADKAVVKDEKIVDLPTGARSHLR